MVYEPHQHPHTLPALPQLRARLPIDPSLHLNRDGHSEADRTWQPGPAH